MSPDFEAARAFEEWWKGKKHLVDKSWRNVYSSKSAWLAGCDWQREQDAKIAEHLGILADHEKSCCGEIPEKKLRQEIANTIRAQEVKDVPKT